jgi:LuxR family maltose regulon positive regulatory protein
MRPTLPATKFYIPTARSDLLPRPRLVRKLAEGLAGPLVLISAPTGFGKTTLLAEWHHSPEGRGFLLAWLSLETEDNDPHRFLSCLITALGSLQPDLLAKAETLLALIQPKAVLTELVNRLSRVAVPFALVLEDYHLIDAGAVHDAAAFLVSHMPPNVHLIISSCLDPPLPLSRLRVRGELTEIRTDDLRFTREESAAYLREIMGLALSAQDVEALEAHTEGWIAGLKLAALSMQNNPDTSPSDFVSEFASSHHYIADYLVEEVLSGLPEDVRRFLLETSVSKCLCGDLCDAITRQNDGQAMLERLEQENLFVVRQDDDREWFRYHHLFADLLRHHLDRSYAGQARELHRRAAEWYAHNDYLYDAIEEAISAQDFELAARVLHGIRTAWTQDEQAELECWVDTLPDSVLRALPELNNLRSANCRGPLTAREMQVLQLIRKGASNREIAQTLVISTGTVKKHLNNIFAKLQAQNREQAVARARELELL